MFNKIKNGFTLAEVLITLVIIGVVAALTIPTAINKYREQTLKSQFRKAYSTLSQALYKTVMNDFYGYVKCAYIKDSSSNSYDYIKTQTSGCTAFYNAFTKNLNVQKVCKGNSKSEGCIPSYKSYPISSGCNGFTQNYVEDINYSYVLSDGQIIITYNTAAAPLFLFDINGHKGPNAYGKDLFSLNIAVMDNDLTRYFFDYQACDFPVRGGRTTAEMVKYSLLGKK